MGKLFIKQVAHELKNYNLYKTFASYFDVEGIADFTAYWNKRAGEELNHHNWVVDYLSEANYPVVYPTIEANDVEIKDYSTPFTASLDREIETTQMIYGLYDGKLPNKKPADGIFLTSGRIMQSRYIKTNQFYRLYMAHPLRQQGVARVGTYVIYSDDFGKTWHSLGAVENIPSVAQDESKLEELPDGSVLLSCRDVYGGRRFNVFTYTNAKKAEGVWGKEVMPANMTAQQVNACNGEILIVPARRISDGKKLYVALQSVPLSAKRDSVGFFYKELASYTDYSTSKQLGDGWNKGLLVTPETSCYSTMIKMDNDRIAFLYETRFYNEGFDIVFQSLDLKKITLGKYEIVGKVFRSKYVKEAAKKTVASH